MADEIKDVQAESSSALGAAIASSPEALEQIEQQAQEAQNPPAEQGDAQEQEEQQAEEPRVPYSRLKEVVDEKNWLKQQLEMQLQRQQSQQQPQQPTTPQEIGNTPEEREFWNMQRRIAREEAQKEQAKMQPVIDAARQELARIGVVLFRQEHPDVRPDSPEEIAIAQRISAGYSFDDAYKTVMYDRKVAQVEKQVNINNKVKIEAKKQANVEQRSIPQGGTAPTKSNLSLRQRIEQAAKDLQF